MTANKVKGKTCIIFINDEFTDKDLKESSLADLCFATVLKDLQARLDPKKFRPLIDNEKPSKPKITPR